MLSASGVSGAAEEGSFPPPPWPAPIWDSAPFARDPLVADRLLPLCPRPCWCEMDDLCLLSWLTASTVDINSIGSVGSVCCFSWCWWKNRGFGKISSVMWFRKEKRWCRMMMKLRCGVANAFPWFAAKIIIRYRANESFIQTNGTLFATRQLTPSTATPLFLRATIWHSLTDYSESSLRPDHNTSSQSSIQAAWTGNGKDTVYDQLERSISTTLLFCRPVPLNAMMAIATIFHLMTVHIMLLLQFFAVAIMFSLYQYRYDDSTGYFQIDTVYPQVKDR